MKKRKQYGQKSKRNFPGKQGNAKSRRPDEKNQPDEKTEIRLNRYIASSGICSRREADTYIKAGLVSVNGEIITQMGTKVSPNDVVRYNGEKIKTDRPVYMLLNKPKDYITSLRDPHATKTVMDLVKNACKERIYPVGRLDRNTTGVMLLTNDGDLTKVLTHPSHNKLKIYHVGLNKPLSGADMKKIREGITLEDGFIKADSISYTDPHDKRLIGIELHSGRNRIVRRIFESLDYSVKKLDRVYFAGLTKKGLTRGKWRFLTEKEIAMLKMGSFQ
jgi:23S rRNA pseudouridine2605 synthase